MEEKNEHISHFLSVTNREEGKLTGVSEVIQFNDKVLIVNTSMGRLNISGTNLHVLGFDEKRGELILCGGINSLQYSDIRSVGKVTKGIIGRLFG